MTGVRKIERCEIILPDDPELFAQLTTRQAFPNSAGKIVLESKEQMRARGLPSPDRAGRRARMPVQKDFKIAVRLACLEMIYYCSFCTQTPNMPVPPTSFPL